METQTEAEFIEVKSPIDRFKEEWPKLSASTVFSRQRKFLLQNPDLVQYAELARVNGWKQPLMFALQGLLLAAFLLSVFSWLITRDEGKSADDIAKVQADLESQLRTEQGVMDSAQFEIKRIEKSRKTSGFTVATSSDLTKEEALRQLNAQIDEAHKGQDEDKLKAELRIQNLHAAGDRFALLASGTAVIFSLSLIFAAPLFHIAMRKQYGKYKLTAQSDGYYLYYVVSRGLWLNLAVVIVLNLGLSGSAYGLGSLTEAIGPIGKITFWLALYAGLLYWFFAVSKDLHKSMQLPRLKDYTGMENKVLLHIHNSFWITFAAFEATLALLAYGVYLLEKP